MAEIPNAVVPIAVVAAVASQKAPSTPEPGAHPRLSGDSTGGRPHELLSAQTEQPTFAGLLGQLRTLHVEPASPSHILSSLAGPGAPAARHNAFDRLADEVAASLPIERTDWIGPTKALPALLQMPASGSRLPDSGATLPPAAGSHTPGVADEASGTDRTPLTALPLIADLTTLAVENRRGPEVAPHDQAPLETPASNRPAAPRPSNTIVAASYEPPRLAVGATDQAVIDSGSLVSTTPGELLPKRKTGDLAGDLATRTASVDFARTDVFQSSPAHALRGTNTDSGLPQSLDLNLPADKTQWRQPLAQRLAWLIQHGANTADLRLNPPHLGRVEVRITIQNDQASIWLSTPNPEVREILEQALPRLGELLESSGLELADSEITDEGFERFMEPHAGALNDLDNATAETVEARGPGHELTSGLLDTYA